MSDEQFPGFIDDEPKPPAKPAKPAAPAPAFDPFADAPVAPAAPAAPVAKAPAAKPPVRPAGKPAAKAPAPAPAFDPFAGVSVDPNAAPPAKATAASQAAAADAEADIKPGMAKDLWACPHCGTKNKPQRESCRQCGKLPSEPVVVPWHQPLGVRLGIAAGVLALLVLVGWLLMGGSVELKPADVAHIDAKPRRGGSPGPQVQLEYGTTFDPREKYAVCGRVLHANPAVNGVTTVVLALGEDGKSEEVASTTAVDLGADGATTTPERRVVVVSALGNVPTFTKGAIVSLLGDVGTLTGVDPLPPGDIVRIDQSH